MAGVLLVQNIITLCQTKYRCVDDRDFPKILLVSYPFSEMLQPGTVLQSEEAVARELQSSIDFLTASNSNSVAIACNTLHSFLKEKNDRFVDMIIETKRHIKGVSPEKVLVLCTNTSKENNLYSIENAVFPGEKEQRIVDDIIYQILQGNCTLHVKGRLEGLVKKILASNRRIEATLLGCSELSVLQTTSPLQHLNIPIIDPLNILSAKLCEYCFNRSP